MRYPQPCLAGFVLTILSAAAIAQDTAGEDTAYDKIDVLRQEKFKALKAQMVKKYDKNGDGSLSRTESRAASPEYRKQYGQIQYELELKLDEGFDTDGDGELSRSEDTVKRMAEKKYQEKKRAQEIAERNRRAEASRKRRELRDFDLNKDGKLDDDEIAKMHVKKAAAEAALAARKAAAQVAMAAAEKNLVSMFDADKDGKFNEEEMVKVSAYLTKQLRGLKAYVDVSRDKKSRDDKSWDDIEDLIRDFRFR